jgi:PAS domain S-box-containing protein
MPLVCPELPWHKVVVTIPAKIGKPHLAPALFRLLEDSALSRAALGCCGIPVALLDANAKGCPFTYVNSAFELFFGYGEIDTIGRSLASVLFRRDEALVQRLLSESSPRWELTAWAKDGEARHVEAALGSIRSADGRLTHRVLAFSDRGEVERLRSEVETLRGLAANSLSVRLDPADQPARSAQKPRVEVPAADELHANRHPRGVLHQR